MMVGAYSRLIAEVDASLHGLCKLLDPGVFLAEPFFNGFGVLLIGPPERTLGRKTKLVEKTTYRCFAEGDAEAFGYRLADHLRSPEGKGELELKGVLHGDRIVDPFHGKAVELRRASSPSPRIKVAPSSLPVSCKPAVHGPTAYLEGAGNHFRALALLHAHDCSLPEFGQCLSVESSGIHGSLDTMARGVMSRSL